MTPIQEVEDAIRHYEAIEWTSSGYPLPGEESERSTDAGWVKFGIKKSELGWRTLEFLESTEETIHRVVRIKDATARPPEIRCERVSPAEVVIHYASERRMCAVARGIARGVADHYGEPVEILEPSCMLRGDAECLIHVRTL